MGNNTSYNDIWFQWNHIGLVWVCLIFSVRLSSWTIQLTAGTLSSPLFNKLHLKNPCWQSTSWRVCVCVSVRVSGGGCYLPPRSYDSWSWSRTHAWNGTLRIYQADWRSLTTHTHQHKKHSVSKWCYWHTVHKPRLTKCCSESHTNQRLHPQKCILGMSLHFILMSQEANIRLHFRRCNFQHGHRDSW